MARSCEECGAEATMHCANCEVAFYCSKACQKKHWKRGHKRVCPVEIAFQRALGRLPPMDQAPKDARCYICLDGEEEGKKLLRGCACRGDSAGFVHVECLTELAMSKEASGGDPQAVFDAWITCGNCKQQFSGALDGKMIRQFWRRHRSNQDVGLRYNSTKYLVSFLGKCGEVDAATQLLDEASTWLGKNTEALLDMKLLRAELLRANEQNVESLELLIATLPEAKAWTAVNPQCYFFALVKVAELLLFLEKNQEGHDAAVELLAFSKAHFGRDDFPTLMAKNLRALACAKLGRTDESKAIWDDVLKTQTRIYGRDHPNTQETRNIMSTFHGAPFPLSFVAAVVVVVVVTTLFFRQR